MSDCVLAKQQNTYSCLAILLVSFVECLEEGIAGAAKLVKVDDPDNEDPPVHSQDPEHGTSVPCPLLCHCLNLAKEREHHTSSDVSCQYMSQLSELSRDCRVTNVDIPKIIAQQSLVCVGIMLVIVIIKPTF